MNTNAQADPTLVEERRAALEEALYSAIVTAEACRAKGAKGLTGMSEINAHLRGLKRPTIHADEVTALGLPAEAARDVDHAAVLSRVVADIKRAAEWEDSDVPRIEWRWRFTAPRTQNKDLVKVRVAPVPVDYRSMYPDGPELYVEACLSWWLLSSGVERRAALTKVMAKRFGVDGVRATLDADNVRKFGLSSPEQVAVVVAALERGEAALRSDLNRQGYDFDPSGQGGLFAVRRLEQDERPDNVVDGPWQAEPAVEEAPIEQDPELYDDPEPAEITPAKDSPMPSDFTDACLDAEERCDALTHPAATSWKSQIAHMRAAYISTGKADTDRLEAFLGHVVKQERAQAMKAKRGTT